MKYFSISQRKKTTMTIVYMQKEVSLPPMYLHRGIKNALLSQLKKNLENSCSQKNGYIVEVKNIESIVSNTISRAYSNIVVKVNFAVETLKPEEGSEFEGEVVMVFEDGVFVMVKNRLKIMIPESTLKKAVYEENMPLSMNHEEMDDEETEQMKKEQSHLSEGRFVVSKGKKKITIKKGDKVKVKVSDLRYEKNNYSCIGVLKL